MCLLNFGYQYNKLSNVSSLLEGVIYMFVFKFCIFCHFDFSMAVFGFTTPAECGEKLTLEITILMSLTFYLQMVSDMQPPTSLNPILGRC